MYSSEKVTQSDTEEVFFSVSHSLYNTPLNGAKIKQKFIKKNSNAMDNARREKKYKQLFLLSLVLRICQTAQKIRTTKKKKSMDYAERKKHTTILEFKMSWLVCAK